MSGKLRVWWVPQVGADTTFYVPVESVEEAKKVMDILAVYDQIQYDNNIRNECTTAGGLEVWDEESQEWNDWFYEDDDSYYDDVDEYCDEMSEHSEKLTEFTNVIYRQLI